MKAYSEFRTDSEYIKYLRGYYTGQAMQGLLTNYVANGHYGNHESYPMVEEQAIAQADRLIALLHPGMQA
jgi:creatinine amidohydrolase/Fe(II)-dependent formamide hydrolase-like protein